MIIAISGSVGTGKTIIAEKISNFLKYEYVPLNEKAKKFKIKEFKELQTFDFNLDNLLKDIEKDIRKIKRNRENKIYEGHFAHFLNPKLIDVLFIINRDLSLLNEEYKNRKYNKQKIIENLEVEAFDLCYYEALDNGFMDVKNIKEIEKKIREKDFGFLKKIENSKNLDTSLKEILEFLKLFS